MKEIKSKKYHYYNVNQNSEEWFKLRAGLITSSNLKVIMTEKKIGKQGNDYALRLVLERLKNERIEEPIKNNYWINRGYELEHEARKLYELENFVTVSNGGFCESKLHDNLGCSPDGLILDYNAGIEIKCVKYNTHYNTIISNSYDKNYKWQLIGNMYICDLDYIDFISYCPEFNESKKLYINRLYKKDFEEEIIFLKERLIEFENLCNEIKNNILK